MRVPKHVVSERNEMLIAISVAAIKEGDVCIEEGNGEAIEGVRC